MERLVAPAGFVRAIGIRTFDHGNSPLASVSTLGNSVNG